VNLRQFQEASGDAHVVTAVATNTSSNAASATVIVNR
jgi:hypothetical protein